MAGQITIWAYTILNYLHSNTLLKDLSSETRPDSPLFDVAELFAERNTSLAHNIDRFSTARIDI